MFQVKCDHEFDFGQLEKALMLNKSTVECAETFERVPVSGLLFGLHRGTLNDVIKWIDSLSDKMAAVNYGVITSRDSVQKN